jgi:hypothetical protein
MSDAAIAGTSSGTSSEYAPPVSAQSQAPGLAAAPSKAADAACLNCQLPLNGSYCSQCGQSARVGRLTVRTVAGEFVSQVIALDHGLLHTIVDLVRRPGQTIRGIFDGRRRTYTGPVTYAALSATLSILFGELSPSFKAARMAMGQPSAAAAKSYTPRQLEAIVHLQRTLATNNLLFIAVLIPPVMLAVRFFLRKYKINLAESGAFACYMLGTITFVASTLSIPFVITANAKAESMVFYAFGSIYVVYAAFAVFGRSFAVAWRTLAAFVVGMAMMGFAEVIVAVIAAR